MNVLHGLLLNLSVPEAFTGERGIDLEILVGVPFFLLCLERGGRATEIRGYRRHTALLLLSAAVRWSSKMATMAFPFYLCPISVLKVGDTIIVQSITVHFALLCNVLSHKAIHFVPI